MRKLARIKEGIGDFLRPVRCTENVLYGTPISLTVPFEFREGNCPVPRDHEALARPPHVPGPQSLWASIHALGDRGKRVANCRIKSTCKYLLQMLLHVQIGPSRGCCCSLFAICEFPPLIFANCK
jgi:hypothetical protein